MILIIFWLSSAQNVPALSQFNAIPNWILLVCEMLADQKQAFWRPKISVTCHWCLRAAHMHSSPEQLLKLPCDSTCGCVDVSWIWWSTSLSEGYLQPRCPRRVCCVTLAEGEQWPQWWPAEGQSPELTVRRQTSQWLLKLITTGINSHRFVKAYIPTLGNEF